MGIYSGVGNLSGRWKTPGRDGEFTSRSDHISSLARIINDNLE
jgi:hypothetical protein